MSTIAKTLFVAAIAGFAFTVAFAGEISGGTHIDATNASNVAGSDDAFAYQDVGTAYGSGRINNSRIYARGAVNHAFSKDFGLAQQYIGTAFQNGTLDNVTVYADGARNRAAASFAFATQKIGTAQNGTIRNTSIVANGAYNNADKDHSRATQKIGVVE